MQALRLFLQPEEAINVGLPFQPARSDRPSSSVTPVGIWPPEAVLAEEILNATLELMISLVTYTLDAADGVSISLVSRQHEEFHTPCATTAEVGEVDAAQYEADEGPCVEAARTGEPVNVSIASQRRRWPQFTRQASERGFRSVLSVPLLRDEQVIGALNVYSQRAEAFPDHDRAVVGHFARHAADVLWNASGFMTEDWIDQRVLDALSTADVVGQAKGILIAKGYTPDEALATLRRASHRSNRKLSDVAQDMVTSSRRARPN